MFSSQTELSTSRFLRIKAMKNFHKESINFVFVLLCTVAMRFRDHEFDKNSWSFLFICRSNRFSFFFRKMQNVQTEDITVPWGQAPAPLDHRYGNWRLAVFQELQESLDASKYIFSMILLPMIHVSRRKFIRTLRRLAISSSLGLHQSSENKEKVKIAHFENPGSLENMKRRLFFSKIDQKSEKETLFPWCFRVFPSVSLVFLDLFLKLKFQ